MTVCGIKNVYLPFWLWQVLKKKQRAAFGNIHLAGCGVHECVSAHVKVYMTA